MRRAVTSVLLIVFLAMSASACVAGWGSQPTSSCTQPSTRQARVITAAMDSSCGHILKSQPARCGMRSFVQLQFAALDAYEISTPLLRAASNLPAPSDSVIVVSSIGSPETDRGPPRS